MASGVIADAQITASSVLEWTDHTGQEHSWRPEKARLKKPGPPWAAFTTDEHQWLQIDLNREKKITGEEPWLSASRPALLLHSGVRSLKMRQLQLWFSSWALMLLGMLL